ncbi:MAG: SigB/SigF/SigG family RNA polymerase sigma factor [Clostridia bacterium]|nr:SigB/SigF/SigG family RNA polymerase sigma factor [Clostridia bacterium]
MTMETLDLIRRSTQGDISAKEQLIQENTGLIYMVVNRFKNRGAEADDLFQIAAIGLLKAIKNFDIRMGLQFSTYAVPMMMGEIRRHLRDSGPMKVSRSYKTLASKAASIREQLMKETGDEPALSEIASRLAVDPAELSCALTATRPPDSLDEVRGDANTTLKDLILTENSEDNLVDRLALRELIGKLPNREKKILLLRYHREQTQSQVAKALGISQVQVSRLEKKILAKLKAEL